jgi:hypothetical protein
MPTVSNPFAGTDPAARASAVRTLLGAAAATILLYFIPYASYLTYPLRLLVTFIHEGSHALVALLTGGHVYSIAIRPDASGVTLTSGGFGPLIYSAGYLGATAFGALLIALLRRGTPGRTLLMMTAIAVGLVTLAIPASLLFAAMPGDRFWMLFGLFWGVVITGGLVLASRRMTPSTAAWTSAFIGVQCILNALFDLHTLFTLSVSTGVPTDARGMQSLTLIPAPVWAVLWIVMSFAMLLFVLRPVKRTAPVTEYAKF